MQPNLIRSAGGEEHVIDGRTILPPRSGLNGSQLAEAVRERLGEGDRWFKGNRADAAGRVCLVGAYAEILYGDADSNVLFSDFAELRDVILEQYPQFDPTDPFIVQRFNDDPNTTWEDVERVLEKTAQRS